MILGRDGADTTRSGHLYLLLFQATLLLGLDMWVTNPHMARILGGFHHQVAGHLTEKLTWHQSYGSLNHPLLVEDMREAGRGYGGLHWESTQCGVTIHCK